MVTSNKLWGIAASGPKTNESPRSQPIPADSTVVKFKTVSTCKSFQTEMTAAPTENKNKKWTKKMIYFYTYNVVLVRRT